MTRPVFLLSLPRSGSTLLQRLIATHPAVATASEPWFLLPLFLGFRDGHVFTSYQQPTLTRAFKDLLAVIPYGTATYHAAIRRFAYVIYEGLGEADQIYFLDKTPRYHLIAEDLHRCFPDARFILLWRQPLAVTASLLKTSRHRWELFNYRVDLYHGLANLIDFQRRHREKIFTLRYEELVADPDRLLGEIFDFLELPPAGKPSERYQEVDLTGRMGDRKGDRLYSAVSTQSRDRWPSSFNTWPRKHWARRYLKWIGMDRLSEAGYDGKRILADLDAQPIAWKKTLHDTFYMARDRAIVALEPAFFLKKWRLSRQGVQVDVSTR